jgi:ubiquinone/menaquinone biosynthesis C-methylase UbiE
LTSNLIATQFDQISEVYDETRKPLKDAAVDKIVSITSRDGCSSIIEIGVGTGRIAKPLQERGLRTVGVDISKGMLLKAREKKIRELILADANNLPIREKSIDGAIFAHVLHIFEDPNEVFKKVVNVVRKEVIALVPKPTESQDNRDEIRETVRLLFEEASAKLGYTLSLGGEDLRELT